MSQHDAARTYTLEKQHLEGPPTLHQLSIRPGGSIVYHYHYPGMSTEWSPDYPLNRDDAAHRPQLAAVCAAPLENRSYAPHDHRATKCQLSGIAQEWQHMAAHPPVGECWALPLRHRCRPSTCAPGNRQDVTVAVAASFQSPENYTI